MSLRPIRFEGDTAIISLTGGYEAAIDAADVELVSGVNWFAHKRKNSVYAVRTDRTGAAQRLLYMHRVILGISNALEVDHRDGNGLNNRRQNLRTVNKSQNAQNQRRSTNNRSGVKGVCWHKSHKRWHAKIMLHGQRLHLGYHDTLEAAADAYARASAEMHGEFGRLE